MPIKTSLFIVLLLSISVLAECQFSFEEKLNLVEVNLANYPADETIEIAQIDQCSQLQHSILIARAQFLEGQYEYALSLLEKHLDSRCNDQQTLAYYYYHLGEALEYTNSMCEGLEFFDTSFEIAKQNNLIPNQAQYFNKVGNIQYTLNRETQGDEFYYKAYTLCNESKDSSYQCFLSRLYTIKSSSKTQSLKHTNSELELLKSTVTKLGFYALVLKILDAQIEIHLKHGELEKSIELSKDAMESLESIYTNELLKYPYLINASTLELEQHHYDKALEYATKANTIAKSYRNFPLQSESYLLISEVYKKLGSDKDARLAYLEHLSAQNLLENNRRVKTIYEHDKALSSYLNDRTVDKLTAINDDITSDFIKARMFSLVFGILALSLILALLTLTKANRNLKYKKQKIESLNASKQILLSILGHDFRKPLLAFRNISPKIDYFISNNDLKGLADFTTSLDKSYNSIELTLANLLAWSQSERDVPFEIAQEENLFDLLEQAISFHKSNSSYKNITIYNRTEQDLKAIVNKLSCETILNNLISNAIKYSHQNGIITLQIDRDTENLNLTVIDDGVGMSPKQIQDIYNNEYQISSLGTNNEKGNGIGLTLVKLLVRNKNGTFEIISKPNEGATIRIILPLSQ